MDANGVKFLMEVMFVFLFASQNPKQNPTLTNPCHTPLNVFSYNHLILVLTEVAMLLCKKEKY